MKRKGMMTEFDHFPQCALEMTYSKAIYFNLIPLISSNECHKEIIANTTFITPTAKPTPTHGGSCR
ncbi:hypothetical protein RO3G_04706 [Rhizopus delemar RA 99-880]|uniref:Uncharacterized protein n=1 Tax=Rhizopus delemar (strain RA 99-880 / ATCC MYA-4621 / FGSC 9543 / NRRL 43880) TaxID=246409 RepID=I1BUX1_RHIO9|nr:hypothetical protein RO3G_04706 [Rhizopus delemar RA 99-880]|eukprot:EIE80001.1 hypothetical protein RO3G_04706 [Rhizopus delemar RA 99-880]